MAARGKHAAPRPARAGTVWRWLAAGAALAVFAVLAVVAAWPGPAVHHGNRRPVSAASSSVTRARTSAQSGEATEPTGTSSTTATTAAPGTGGNSGGPGAGGGAGAGEDAPADMRRLTLVRTIGGGIAPASVAVSATGLVFVPNPSRDSVTVYDGEGTQVGTISGAVQLSSLGVAGHPGMSAGAPLEAAFVPGGSYAYVSNSSMSGAGFGPPGQEVCSPDSAAAAGVSDSYVYRVDTRTLAVDQAIEVGFVPEFLAVSPNGKWLLVANWCSYDVSVVDVADGEVVATVPTGPYPRGIAFAPDSSVAFVAIMGGDTVDVIDLSSDEVLGNYSVGLNPRHLVVDPSGLYLYASLNAPGEVVKVDLNSGKVVARVHTGADCRSLAISPDGTALFVDNEGSGSLSVLRASDLGVLQTVPTGPGPVGVAYDPVSGDVWVALTSGKVDVFADR